MSGTLSISRTRKLIIRYRTRAVQKQNNLCFYCMTEMLPPQQEKRASATADHIIPISRGGTHSEENIVACCGRCNRIKKNNKITFTELLNCQLKLDEEIRKVKRYA